MEIELTSLGFNSDTDEKAWAEEMAWSHATLFAQSNGISLGSDDFETLFIRLRERYSECSEHIGFLHHLGSQVLSELMQLGMGIGIARNHTQAEIMARFNECVAVIMSAIAWSFASSTDGWVPNQDWNGKSEEDRSVRFTIYKEDKDGHNDSN